MKTIINSELIAGHNCEVEGGIYNGGGCVRRLLYVLRFLLIGTKAVVRQTGRGGEG